MKELSCPLSSQRYRHIVAAHGSGGKLTQELLDGIIFPAFDNLFLQQRHDGAILPVGSRRVAFTSDSFVVTPLFFPGGNIGRLAVNGTVKTLDFSNAEFLPDPAVLPAERFTSDTDSCYYGRHVFVPAVPPTARGEVTANLVVAHPSVQKSALTLSADTVLYADIGSDLLFKKDMAEFRLSEGLLAAVSGKLVLMDIAKLYIEKDVTAEMLLQKVCLIADVALLRATKETFDVAQLLAHNVAKIRRR